MMPASTVVPAVSDKQADYCRFRAKRYARLAELAVAGVLAVRKPSNVMRLRVLRYKLEAEGWLDLAYLHHAESCDG